MVTPLSVLYDNSLDATEPEFDYKNLKKGKSGGVSGGSRSRSKSLKKRKSISPD